MKVHVWNSDRGNQSNKELDWLLVDWKILRLKVLKYKIVFEILHIPESIII